MLRVRPAPLVLAAPLLLAQTPPAAGPGIPGGSVQALGRIDVLGGSGDDQAFARAALGVTLGRPLDAAGLEEALAAVRLTDRFRQVQGAVVPEGGGAVLRLSLEPWPEVATWEVRGDLPAALRKALPFSIRKGQRLGDLRLEELRQRLEVWLQESGYPKGRASVVREEGGRRIVFPLDPGAPALVRSLRVEGELGPYSAEKLQKLSGLVPGRSLWTAESRREALAGIRKRFLKDSRYFWQADVRMGEDGAVTLQAAPGPIVRLKKEGEGLGWSGLKDLVPLSRAERFTPDLLDEGARRILRKLRSKGYLDAEVVHRTELVEGTEAQPKEVRLVYQITPGTRMVLKDVRFERNQELDSRTLTQAAAVPSGYMGLGTPWATPELIGTVEERVKSAYRSRGFNDIALRRPTLERKGDQVTLALEVREGSQRFLSSMVLDVPDEEGWIAWDLAQALPLMVADRPVLESVTGGRIRRYRSDRPAMASYLITVEELETPTRPGFRTFRLRGDRPFPLVRYDITSVLVSIRQRLGTWGVLRPAPEQLRLTEGPQGAEVHLEIPRQPRTTVTRLMVQGADATRAEAVLSEAQLTQGQPLGLDRLSRAQGQVANLGNFERVDLFSAKELSEDPKGGPWEDGDLVMRLRERSPWVFRSSFGYDKSQGYHFGLGAQRLNLGGMGRTLDFSIRAGDLTIDNPTLRKWFPTGPYPRSMDNYSIGYTDPRFRPAFLEGWLPDQTKLLSEAAYIEELRSLYLLRRRRFTGGLEWRPGPEWVWQAGYRFERSDVKAAPGVDIRDEDLWLVAGIPGQAVVSAPYLQLLRDRRDNPLDPIRGTFTSAKLEVASEFLGSSTNSSFIKVDMRRQTHWPVGRNAAAGVVSLGLRLGVAYPTTEEAKDMPLAERFFAGGPGTHRGVEPDSLGDLGVVPKYGDDGQPILGPDGQPETEYLPLGGQLLALINLEYRFPIPFLGSAVWGEVFIDSGQVYQSLESFGQDHGAPPLRTALGLGVIFKIGLPLKIEYAADVKRIMGKPRTPEEEYTQLKSLLVSAGFQF